MAAVTTDLISKLRAKSGAGIMDCKKALQETDADVEKAIEFLRKKGLADAGKKSGRATREGLVAAFVSQDGMKAALVEVNCETDFVARTDDFKSLCAEIAKGTAEGTFDDAGAEELVKGAIAKLGENMKIARREALERKGAGRFEPYIHSGRAGTIVELGCGKDDTAGKPEFVQVAKELALQVVGASPRWTRREDVPEDVLAKEREIFSEQLRKEGKPEKMFEKIIPGKLNKFYSLWCLVDQPSIRDSSGKTKVGTLIDEAGAKLGDVVEVRRFVHIKLGAE